MSCPPVPGPPPPPRPARRDPRAPRHKPVTGGTDGKRRFPAMDSTPHPGPADDPATAPGTPRDTAHLVEFLCSHRGGWINGQLLKSDGGIA
ncbi:hypothetical protein GCM10009716_18900 [Streptomyces sodiiphilus]|uniref:SDR family oxidoreductase n=1 Tax=Streptomyces sodiiphilus TaxID=226217 RepID=A0ABP5AET0_9ACTN